MMLLRVCRQAPAVGSGLPAVAGLCGQALRWAMDEGGSVAVGGGGALRTGFEVFVSLSSFWAV